MISKGRIGRLFTLALLMSFTLGLTNVVHAASPSSKMSQKSDKVKPMNAADFKKLVFDYTKEKVWANKAGKPVLIDLYADWCGPCRRMAPIVEEMAQKYPGIAVYKVDVDKESELAQYFNASSIPLFVFIPKEGKPQLMKGATSKADFEKAVKMVLLGK